MSKGVFFGGQNIDSIIKNMNKKNIHIVTDFDRTITSGDSKSSWSLFAYSGYMPAQYIEKREELYKIYRPVENNLSISREYREEKMKEWWDKHLEILVEYNLSEKIVQSIAFDEKHMHLRDDAAEFLSTCKDYNIPVIIISAGIGNIILEFLKHNEVLYDNIYIISNFLQYENGIVKGFDNHIIHSLNKNEQELPYEAKDAIKDRPYSIIMGDGIDDIRIVSKEQRENSLAVGFLEDNIEDNLEGYTEVFDIVYTNNTSLKPMIKLIESL